MSTGPVGTVEGEIARGKVLEGLTVTWSREVLAEHNGLGLHRLPVFVDLPVPGNHLDFGYPLGQGKGGLHGFGQAPFEAVSEDEAIHHYLDGVHLVTGQVQVVTQLVDLPVYHGPAEPLGR